MKAKLRLLSLTAATCLLLSALPVHAALSVSFEGSVVRITGVTPGGQVALISVMRETRAQMIVGLKETQQLLSDSDKDGAIDFDYKKPIPWRSIWAAVDVDSGASITAAPAGFPTRESALPAGLVRNAPSSEFDDLIGEHMVMYMLWVRPGNGGGAWFLSAADGGANDADGHTNGRAVTSTAAFATLDGAHKAPKKLKKDDVLILLDPFAMNSSRGVISQ